MTDPYTPSSDPYGERPATGGGPPQPSAVSAWDRGGAPQSYGSQPYGWVPQQGGPVGEVRPTGIAILLFLVTLGIYGYVWAYKTHEEMKQHTGQGLGGGLALAVWFFLAPVLAFLHSDEVGKLYARRGEQAPVTSLNGLWFFPGMFLLIGPLVWFVRTNGALNDYWRSVGAPG